MYSYIILLSLSSPSLIQVYGYTDANFKRSCISFEAEKIVKFSMGSVSAVIGPPFITEVGAALSLICFKETWLRGWTNDKFKFLFIFFVDKLFHKVYNDFLWWANREPLTHSPLFPKASGGSRAARRLQKKQI